MGPRSSTPACRDFSRDPAQVTAGTPHAAVFVLGRDDGHGDGRAFSGDFVAGFAPGVLADAELGQQGVGAVDNVAPGSPFSRRYGPESFRKGRGGLRQQ